MKVNQGQIDTYKRSAFGVLKADVAGAGDESRSEEKKTSEVQGSSSSFSVYKKKQAVRKLLRCGKENILLYEGQSEYTKKRRNMKKGANRSPPREGVIIGLERKGILRRNVGRCIVDRCG